MNNDTSEKEFSQATIQECPNEPHDPFTIIPNALLRDESISPNCRWLICYLLTNRPGWKINIFQICSHVKSHMGRDKVYSILNEAIQAGYIKRENRKDGNLIRSIYYVSKTARFKKCFRLPEFQEAENPDPENPHNKKNIDKNKHKKEDKQSQAPAHSTSRKKEKEQKKEVAPRVWLNKTQEDALLKKLEGDLILLKKCYEKLSDWKIGKGRTGGSNDYASFTNWVIEAVKDDSLKSTATSSKNKVEDDKKTADKIWNRCKGRTDIHLGYNYIEFDNGQQVAHLEFGSKDFRENCIVQLKKRKINSENF